MVTISNADKALKTFYLGVLADQLNVGVNPLFAKIAQTSSDVWGKEVKKLAPYGINGGVGSGEENDNLPQSGGNNYAQFTFTLKNLFGKIELSDKAIRASQNSSKQANSTSVVCFTVTVRDLSQPPSRQARATKIKSPWIQSRV